MTAETYAPRRSAGISSGKFQPRVGQRGIDPVDELLEALEDLSADLRARAARAGGRDRSLIGRELDDVATEVRRIIEEHQP